MCYLFSNVDEQKVNVSKHVPGSRRWTYDRALPLQYWCDCRCCERSIGCKDRWSGSLTDAEGGGQREIE